MWEIVEFLAAPAAAGLILVGIHGYLGLHVLLRQVIFVDLALAQIAALGAVVAFMEGHPLGSWPAFGFSLAATLVGAAIFSLSRTRDETVPQEAIIGITYVIATAATILIADRAPEGAEHLRELLAGAILWVGWPKVVKSLLVYSAVGLFHYLVRRKLILISEDPERAYREGVKVRLWDFWFYASFGLVITLSVQIAGVLMVFSYLVAPAIIALAAAKRWRTRVLLAWSVGVAATLLGLAASYAYDLPSGPAIVCMLGLFLILYGAGRAARRHLAALIFLATLTISASTAVAGTNLPVLLDGSFREWRSVEEAVIDPAGDAAEGALDLGSLWLADDGEALYLRLTVGRETILQNAPDEAAGSALTLYLDLDASTATGRPVEGLGAEIEVRFGERRVIFYDPVGVGEIVNGGLAGVVGLPTHSGEQFEIRVPLPDGAATGELALVAIEEIAGGDRLPDFGAVDYIVSDSTVGPPKATPVERRKRTDFRLLSHNVGDSRILAFPNLYRRLLRAVSPDLVVLQEIDDGDAAATLDFVTEALPPAAGDEWLAVTTADVVTLSKFPITAAAAVDGNLAVHVDLPGERDLVLINVHLPCCGNETARDAESDNAAALWRDLLAGTGPFPIADGDAVIYAGDFNFVGYRRQVEAIRDGRFVDPARGPDFEPGRRKGSLAAAPLRQSAERTTVTWRRFASPFAPGRLDWVFYSRDALKHRRSFVLDVDDLPRRDRKAAGLKRRDTARASDHLPLVVDFRVR